MSSCGVRCSFNLHDDAHVCVLGTRMQQSRPVVKQAAISMINMLLFVILYPVDGKHLDLNEENNRTSTSRHI